MSLSGMGARSLVPDELLEGYGYDPATDVYLIDPASPLSGHVFRRAGYPSPAVIEIHVGGSEFPEQLIRLNIWQAAYDAVMGGIGRVQGPLGSGALLRPNPAFVFRWRAQATADAWTEVPGQFMGVSLSTLDSTRATGSRIVGQVIIEDRRLDPTDPLYDATVADLPGEEEIVEFFLLGPIPPDEEHPIIVEMHTPNAGLGGDATDRLVPLAPLLGYFTLVFSAGGVTTGTIDLLAVPGNAEATRRLRVATYEALSNESTVEDIFIPSGGTFRWLGVGANPPWIEVTLDPAAPGGASLELWLKSIGGVPVSGPYRIFESLIITGPATALPSVSTPLQFAIRWQESLLPPTGLTAGQFLVNLYAGLYSARDPVTGLVAPTGIRYDEPAFAQMTDLVRLRLTDPVDDARDWAEKYIYTPTGWVPALDSLGRISPVSQVRPSLASVTDEIDDAMTEPSPDWDAGQRIINVVRLTYQRDYSAGPPDPPPPAGFEDSTPRQNVIEARDIVVEFRDEVSIARHGEQVLEIDGLAFRAVGRIPTLAEESGLLPASIPPRRARDRLRRQRQVGGVAPITDVPIVRTGAYVLPIFPNIVDETGWQLANNRQLHLLPRFALGAPTVSINVLRSAIPTVRVGTWVLLNLSWFPDYITRRRGLVTMGQVVAIGELDCAWRRCLVETVKTEFAL